MSVAGNFIKNGFDGTIADLANNNPAPGTTVICQTVNQPPKGTFNQMCRVDAVPAGVNLYTIRNVAQATYAGTADSANNPGLVRYSSKHSSILLQSFPGL
jgi:hypothetical protein